MWAEYGMGWGWGFLGVVHMVLWWALIILGIIVLVKWLAVGVGPSRGEIGREEFEQKKRDLRD
jgi:hypothetical protein